MGQIVHLQTRYRPHLVESPSAPPLEPDQLGSDRIIFLELARAMAVLVTEIREMNRLLVLGAAGDWHG